MPAAKERIRLEKSFSNVEFTRICRGLIPKAMEDKWFIYFDEGVLNFHRSWTGSCIYQVAIVQVGDGTTASEAWVNRDPKQYKLTDAAYDAALLNWLIDALLLGKSIPFPVLKEYLQNVPAGAHQHNVAGTGYPEKIVPSKRGWLHRLFSRISKKK